jgi:hypothetical protein
MDIRGLLLANSEQNVAGNQTLNLPLATLDVAGKSTLQRMAERLQQYGLSQVSAVVESTGPSGVRNFGLPSDVTCVSAAPDRFWKAAESAFNDMAQSGAELVILVRLGAYAEVDFEKLVQFHIDRKERVTQMAADEQKLEIFCISASRRNDAASLFRTQLAHCRSECPLLQHDGYLNQMASARDLRQFAIYTKTKKIKKKKKNKEWKERSLK